MKNITAQIDLMGRMEYIKTKVQENGGTKLFFLFILDQLRILLNDSASTY